MRLHRMLWIVKMLRLSKVNLHTTHTTFEVIKLQPVRDKSPRSGCKCYDILRDSIKKEKKEWDEVRKNSVASFHLHLRLS